MATEYKLSYTATDINARLGKINQLSENVADLQDNINAVQSNVEQVQDNVEQVQSNLEQHNISTTAHADIRTEITTATSNLKEELLDGANTEYNTFKKLGELINNNASNIDQLTDNKQDTITGVAGQIVGFDENGNAIAQNNPSAGGSGGGLFVVNIANDLSSVDKTFSEIQTAYENGQSLRFVMGLNIFDLQTVNPGNYVLLRNIAPDTKNNNATIYFTFIWIYSDGTIEYSMPKVNSN